LNQNTQGNKITGEEEKSEKKLEIKQRGTACIVRIIWKIFLFLGRNVGCQPFGRTHASLVHGPGTILEAYLMLKLFLPFGYSFTTIFQVHCHLASGL
jgi:hypothetical protein